MYLNKYKTFNTLFYTYTYTDQAFWLKNALARCAHLTKYSLTYSF